MKRTLLSLSVALACSVSHSTFAASSSDDSLSLWEQAGEFGGHIGTAYTYEDEDNIAKGTWGSSSTNTITRTKDIVNLAYTNALWDLSLTYLMQEMDIKSKGEVSNGFKSTQVTETESHTFTLNKSLNFTGGWSGGLLYSFQIDDGEIESIGTFGAFTNHQTVNTIKKTHTVKPYVNYWSNSLNAGVEFGIQYEDTHFDQAAWGTQDTKAYSYILKPYKRYGNWEFAVELYYQDSEMEQYDTTTGVVSLTEDAIEKYFEPIIQYSFEDAGTLYARYRIGDREWTQTAQPSGVETKYLRDIRKGTIGYQQLLTQDWEVKAEYEFSSTEDETVGQYDVKDVDKDKFYLHALYRF